jgi:hypothetical protein
MIEVIHCLLMREIDSPIFYLVKLETEFKTLSERSKH